MVQRCKDEDNLIVDTLEKESRQLIEYLCKVKLYLKSIALKKEEYVLLKVIIMTRIAEDKRSLFNNNLTIDQDGFAIIESIHCKYLNALSCLTSGHRYELIIRSIQLIEECATKLLNSKMFYVPFLLTSNI